MTLTDSAIDLERLCGEIILVLRGNDLAKRESMLRLIAGQEGQEKADAMAEDYPFGSLATE